MILRLIIITLISLLISSCHSTRSEIHQDDSFPDDINLSILNQNHANIILVRVIEVKYRLNNIPRSYPLEIEMQAEVLKVYKGAVESLNGKITLVTAKESLDYCRSVTLPINQKFITFLDAEYYLGNCRYQCEFIMYDYNKALELRLLREIISPKVIED